MSRAPVRRGTPVINPKVATEDTRPTTPAEIETVSFSILTKRDLEAAGAPVISRREDPVAGQPDTLNGTLFDPRMGYSSYWNSCATCFKSQAECPGHMGYIDFRDRIHVINPFAGTLVASLLNIICQHCARPFFRPEDLTAYDLGNVPLTQRVARLERVLPLSGKEALRCPAPLDEVSMECQRGNKTATFNEADLSITLTKPPSTDKTLMSTARIHRLFLAFENQAEEAVEALGFKRFLPSDLVMTFLPVVPPCVRETTSKGAGTKSLDTLGKEYKAILSSLIALEAVPSTRKGARVADPGAAIVGKILSVFGLKKTKTTVRRPGENLRDYKKMLSGKKGVIRGKMQGKRLDTTARTVGIPGPDIPLDCIGVPRSMVEATPEDPSIHNKLYVRVPITEFNREYLEEQRDAGVITRYFQRGAHSKGKLLTPKVPRFRFRPGDEVGRALQNGDYIMFNRNPSIHRISLLAFKVILVDGLTFMINPAGVGKFNMDFDGDETNIKVVSELHSQAEARFLVSEDAHAINAENSTASNGLIQDNITAAYMMTNPTDVRFEHVTLDVNALLDRMHRQEDVDTLEERLRLASMTLDSPRGLLSACLPSSFYYDVDGVKVFRGVLYEGTLKKAHVGAATNNSIHQHLAHYAYLYGKAAEREFLMDASTITGEWLSSQHGFSVGHADTLVNNPRIEELRTMVNNRVRAIVEQIDVHTENAAELERVEREIAGVLNQSEGFGLKVTDEVMRGDNPIRIMVKGGAKGSFVHLANITAMLGQQFVGSARTPLDMNGTRTTAYSLPGSTDPTDRGWSVGNYNVGLNPLETFTQQMATRPLLADTSLKTSDVGDLARRVGLFLENKIVHYDGTIRDQNNVIVDFSCGPEAFNPQRLLLQRDRSLFPMDVHALAMIANAEVMNDQLA